MTAAPLPTDTVGYSLAAVPVRFAAELRGLLQAGERVRACLQTDLDTQLNFAEVAVVVTDLRLLARSPHDSSWQRWPLRAGLRLEHHDHAGVGLLELLDERARLAGWRYTRSRNGAVSAFISEFELCRSGLAPERPLPPQASDDVCPQCRAVLPSGEDECPACARSPPAPPSTWTLLRLWRFARPYRGRLFVGFALTVASTAATLVPPYLTMPLMDKVLIPFQNGAPIDWQRVGMYLGGLLGAEYRRNIGLVLQEPFLFFGTIADNIAYGRPQATRAEIVNAARAAYAHEFILRLPLGYDSLVGERGQGLSGGERQRISIARALLIDPRILMLDEATSAVDTETEKEIQKALENLIEGRTTIAIAHRLSTLGQADRLVVLDRGRIVEIGSHDTLMATEGYYHKLFMAQLRTAELGSSPGLTASPPMPARRGLHDHG